MQCLDGRVGVLGGGVVMTPVAERGCTAVDLVQGTDEIGDMDVPGGVVRSYVAVDAAQVFQQGPIGPRAP